MIGRELVLSTWYGRRQKYRLTIGHVPKNIQVEFSQTVWAGFLLTGNTLHKSHLVATLDNTPNTPKYKCRGSWFQSPKVLTKVQTCCLIENKQDVQNFEQENVQIPPLPNFWKVTSTSQAKHDQGTHGFEPWTYRTAADCSTTELYPPYITRT